MNTNLANAIVICIDKYNHTNVIPCSDQNAIDIRTSQHANMTASNMTSAGIPNITASNTNTLTNATANASATNANLNSNTTNLISDVKVVSEQSQKTAGFLFLIHYIVFGNVANIGNGTSGPVTVHLQITLPQGAVLYSTDGSTMPDTLAPKQEGKFTFEFTSDDLGGYKSGDWTYDVSVVKQ